MTTTIQQKIQEKFPNAIISFEQQYDFPILTIQKQDLKNVLKFLKEDTTLNFHFLTTLCGTHFPENEIELEFGIMYQLHNMPNNWRIRIKAYMSKSDLNIETVTDIWKTANWMERQEYDFFGFNFIGHPNLCRILNMDEMNYFPMRKEYPLEDLQRDDKEDKMFGR
jgi:NADH-quinone oxidoreductase subunit C